MVAVIFVKRKYILPKDITNAADEYFFACLPIAKGEKNASEKVVSSMYKDNIQIRREGDLSAFHKVNSPLLWFFNIVGCRRCLVFACFADDSAFGNHTPDISCYDNCFYSLYKGANAGYDSSMPDWELYNITMKHFLRYLKTNK